EVWWRPLAAVLAALGVAGGVLAVRPVLAVTGRDVVLERRRAVVGRERLDPLEVLDHLAGLAERQLGRRLDRPADEGAGVGEPAFAVLGGQADVAHQREDLPGLRSGRERLGRDLRLGLRVGRRGRRDRRPLLGLRGGAPAPRSTGRRGGGRVVGRRRRRAVGRAAVVGLVVDLLGRRGAEPGGGGHRAGRRRPRAGAEHLGGVAAPRLAAGEACALRVVERPGDAADPLLAGATAGGDAAGGRGLLEPDRVAGGEHEAALRFGGDGRAAADDRDRAE